MKVRRTRPTIGRLAEIKQYISENNAEHAKRFISSLYFFSIFDVSPTYQGNPSKIP